MHALACDEGAADGSSIQPRVTTPNHIITAHILTFMEINTAHSQTVHGALVARRSTQPFINPFCDGIHEA